MLAIGLKCEACPDGVERAEEEGSQVYRYRTDARFPVVVASDGTLEGAVILQFLNAGSDEEKAAFMRAFGLIDAHYTSEGSTSPVGNCEDFDLLQSAFLHVSKMTDEISQVNAIERANSFMAHMRLSPQLEQFGPSNSPVVRFIASNVADYMRLELGIYLRNGAQTRSCLNCSRLFFYGTGTGRRSTAEFCRDVCRVQASRKKKAA